MSTENPPRPSVRELWTDKFGVVATRSAQVIMVLALAVVFVFVTIQLKLIVIPILIAMIIASAFAPVMRFLRNRGMPAIAATWLTLLASTIVFGGLIYLIVIAVQNQFDTLADSAVEGFETLVAWVQTLPIPIDQEQLDSFVGSITDFLTSSQFGSGALAGVTVIGELITGAVLAVVILFFFLKDGDRIWEFFLRPFTGERLERGRRIGHVAVKTMGGYVRGTATVAAVDALAIGIALAILQVPLALPLAVIVFVAAFIPIVGATVAGILAALVALVDQDAVTALIVIIVVIAVNQLEGNFLQPVVMAQSLKLHPLVVLLALAAGTILANIIGAILAVPIAAVAWAIIKAWNVDKPAEVKTEVTRRRRRLFGRRPAARRA